jgi:hypothetical protein
VRNVKSNRRNKSNAILYYPGISYILTTALLWKKGIVLYGSRRTERVVYFLRGLTKLGFSFATSLEGINNVGLYQSKSLWPGN